MSRLGRMATWLDRFAPSESTALALPSLLVGLATGLTVVLFKRSYALLQGWTFGSLGGIFLKLSPYGLILIPAIGGLIVGLLAKWFVGYERHHGVAGIMEAVALAGGRLRYRRIPMKILLSVLSLGFGASVGPEDPSVQIGSGLGSMLGQRLGMSDQRVRVLVAAGAASGIATAFNAPLAGVFFALEIVLVGEFTIHSFGVVVLSSVLASVISRAIVGPTAAFAVPLYALNSPIELPLYFGLGLVAAPVAVAYINSIYRAQDLAHAINIPSWIKPAIGGLLLGLIALWLPQVLGEGYSTVGNILQGTAYLPGLLLLLVLVKIVATSMSLASGFVGGVFAPSLFLGAALGGAFGSLSSSLFPGLNIQPSAYALVGMAAVLASTVRAPITAILLLFELTNDYRILLPLMFAVTVSLFLSELLQSESIYSLGLVRKGIHLSHSRDVDLLESLSVGEVMETDPPVLEESVTLDLASKLMQKERFHGLPVTDASGRLVGVLSTQDIHQAMERNPSMSESVGEACTRELLVTYIDEPVQRALLKMNMRDIGRLPVVRREDAGQLVGLLRRADVLKAYDVARMRRQAARQQAEEARLGAYTGSDVIELQIASGSAVEGHTLSQIRWPRESVVAGVVRNGRLLYPHGDTLLKVGDRLVLLASPEIQEQILRLVNPEQAPAAGGQAADASEDGRAESG
jgi:CIC family chloride channel protein